MYEDSQVEQEQVALAAEVFSLLSDVTRVRIVLALRDAEMSVGHLAEAVGKSPTAVSQHLAKLRWGRMVRARQAGNRVYYSLADAHAAHLVTEAVLQARHLIGERSPEDHGHGPRDGAHATET